jgi:hypothetical protein
MRIAITTKDEAFATQHGTGLDASGRTVITVPDASIEWLKFAGASMIRFDMALVAAGRLPRDWANRWTMLPQSRIVA